MLTILAVYAFRVKKTIFGLVYLVGNVNIRVFTQNAFHISFT